MFLFFSEAYSRDWYEKEHESNECKGASKYSEYKTEHVRKELKWSLGEEEHKGN